VCSVIADLGETLEESVPNTPLVLVTPNVFREILLKCQQVVDTAKNYLPSATSKWLLIRRVFS
jgi:hypothetical protein